ncbi:3ank: A designed ankyrin repeat protein, partial [Tuber magnatum]
SANIQGRYPLSIAAAMGDEALVRLLLFWGADVCARDDMGRTALHRAAGCGMAGVVKLLLEKGADREVADYTGRTALGWADKENVKELLLREQSV